MAIMNFVLLLILVSPCLAEETQTVNLEEQSTIKKREKQNFIEDDESDGPSVKRDERQSPSSRTNLSENDAKILQNSLNGRLRPKTIPVQFKPVKPKVIVKPLNVRIDAAPKRIPTKIPIVLKTANVIPAPAHALRMKMIESLKNESLAKPEARIKENKLLSSNEDHNCSEHAIPYTTEDKKIHHKKHEVPKNEAKQIVKPVQKIASNVDPDDCSDEDVLSRNGKVTENKDQKEATNNDKKDEIIPPLVEETNFRRANTAKSATPVKPVPKPVYFYEDEVDPTPLLKKQRPKPENTESKHKEPSPQKTKEIPITRRAGNKLAIEESIHHDDDPDTIRIINGTHLITVKKLQDHEKPKSESRQHVEEKIVNKTPIVEKPEPKTNSRENNLAPLVNVDNRKQIEQYTDPHNSGKTGINQGKDPNESIVISNHDYEEVEERTTMPPPVQAYTPTATNPYDNRAQDSWNYLQNLYYNPYYPNIYNQYRRYYENQEPHIYKDTNEFAQNLQNPYNAQIFIPNENEVVYNDFNRYGDEAQVESNCPIKQQENTLDRIWRTWKDTEIKIRNNNEDPADIDIRRHILFDNFNNEINGNVPTAAVTQPIGINGYYNNQNSALLHPYYNPYRYLL